MTRVTWFRPPAGDAGLINACYNALDMHVVRGRADDTALQTPAGERDFAWLLSEVAALAGVLRAFRVSVGEEVSIAPLPPENGVITALALARVGAVAAHADSGIRTRVAIRLTSGTSEGDIVVSADGEDLPWEVAMRAGRTDPAPCAEVPGDAILARHGDHTLSVLQALGVWDVHESSPPPGATLVSVGGVDFWSFDAPGATG